jgi:hypothetical protein
MVVIVRVAAIFPGRQSGRWGVHDTRSHWRGRGRERGDGGWSRERGNSFVMALKKGYEEEEGSEREGSVRGTGCARGRERAGGRVLFVRYTEKQRPRAKDAREEKRKSRLDHNLIFREDTKAKHDGGQRTTATTLRDCGTDSPRTWSTRPNRLGALAIYGSNSFITRHVSLSQRALLLFVSVCPATTMATPASADSDILSLRAQLKAFEREFRATHHHAPSVDDIRNAGFGATRVTSHPETDPWLITTP